MSRSRRILIEDMGTKALSLILALAVYVHVFSGREREMSYRVPLEISPLPIGLAVAGGIPSEVRIRVRASGKDLLKLKTRPFHAEIAVDSPHSGYLQRPILPSDFRLPRGVRVSAIEVLEPRTLNLDIEKLGSKQVRVSVRVQDDEDGGRALLERPSVNPELVRLTGPTSMLASIDSAETEPISVGESEELEAVIVPPSGLTAEPKRVVVRIRTDERHVRRYPGLSIDLSAFLKGRLLWVQPTEATVVISGAASTVDAISPDRIRVSLDLKRVTAGAQRVRLKAALADLPLGAPLRISCFPESVSVRLQ